MRLKVCTLFLLYLSSSFTSLQAQSSINNYSCDKEKITNLGEKDSVYAYKIEKTCSSSSINDLYQIKSKYLESIQNDRDNEILRIEEGAVKDNLNGLKIELKQEYQSDHGLVKATGDLFLLNNNTSKFLYDFKTKTVKGNGNAKYTRSIEERVDVDKVRDKKIIISKIIRVKKPWMAPFYIFDSEIRNGLTKDMKFLAKKHLEIITQ